jgi:hypothetical protein
MVSPASAQATGNSTALLAASPMYTIDSDGRIVVADTYNHRVQVLD